MKQTIFAILALLFLSANIFAQPQDKEWAKQQYKEYEKKGLLWNYDKFRDETTILTKPQLVQKPGMLNMMAAPRGSAYETPFITFSAGIYFKGKSSNDESKKTMLAFNISAGGWKQLKSDREIRLMFGGGEVIKLGKAEYDGDVNTGGTNETLMVDVDAKNLARMVSAETVMVQIGRTEFVIKDKHLKSLQPLVDLMASSTPKQSEGVK